MLSCREKPLACGFSWRLLSYVLVFCATRVAFGRIAYVVSLSFMIELRTAGAADACCCHDYRWRTLPLPVGMKEARRYAVAVAWYLLFTLSSIRIFFRRTSHECASSSFSPLPSAPRIFSQSGIKSRSEEAAATMRRLQALHLIRLHMRDIFLMEYVKFYVDFLGSSWRW